MDALVAIVAAGLAGFGVAAWLARVRVADPPAALMRVNVNNREVPAVLGEAVAVGALSALGATGLAAGMGWEPAATGRTGIAAAIVVFLMAVAGAADDRRGDETARGFAGHFAALRSGKLSGGMVKIAASVIAGVAAALLLFPGEAGAAAATVLLIALGSNSINLLDRAPGRAAKVFLAAALPLLAFGDVRWAIAAAGAVGALVACLPSDLHEKGMLGDAGANPLGALLGLGLAVSLGGGGRWFVVALLVGLNAASERWSFSRAIARTPWLERLDRIGRK